MRPAHAGCRIEEVLGPAEACQGEMCALWEPGMVERCAGGTVEPEEDGEVFDCLVEMRSTVETLRAVGPSPVSGSRSSY
jgi:hypothetical protein